MQKLKYTPTNKHQKYSLCWPCYLTYIVKQAKTVLIFDHGAVYVQTKPNERVLIAVRPIIHWNKQAYKPIVVDYIKLSTRVTQCFANYYAVNNAFTAPHYFFSFATAALYGSASVAINLVLSGTAVGAAFVADNIHNSYTLSRGAVMLKLSANTVVTCNSNTADNNYGSTNGLSIAQRLILQSARWRWCYCCLGCDKSKHYFGSSYCCAIQYHQRQPTRSVEHHNQ